MKKLIAGIMVLSLLVAGLGTVGMARGGYNKGQGKSLRNGHGNPCLAVEESQKYELSAQQKEDLIFMYQEEKMARDLYSAFEDKWNTRIFTNIAASEQKHMEAIKCLLDKYDIEVPNNEPEEFSNEILAQKYEELLDKGLSSYQAALEVGKTVENKDIVDLEDKIEKANPDAKVIFENLKRGSENHLAAFRRQLN